MISENHPLRPSSVTTAVSTERQRLEMEIAELRPRAQAERFVSIVDVGRDNPWTGSIDRLAAAEGELHALDERDAARAFVAALERYEDAVSVARDESLRSQMRRVAADLGQSDARLIDRWRHEISMLHESDDLYRLQARTLAALAVDHDAEIPASRLPFSDAEIRAVAKHMTLEAEQRELHTRLHSQVNVMRAIEARYPVLRDLAGGEILSTLETAS